MSDRGMTDIVERLRGMRGLGVKESFVTLDAAVEIERLRSALHDIVDGRGHDTGSAGARTIAAKALAGEPWE